MVGFFEESAGVRSMTRLTIAWTMLLCSALVGAVCWYLVRGTSPSAEVIVAMGGLLATLAIKTIVAILNRNPPDAS